MASLFTKGSLFVSKPIQVKYLIIPSSTPQVQAAFAVPKRRFAKAVDRNQLKRKIKNAHRLNQLSIQNGLKDSQFSVFVLYIYIENEKRDYALIEKAVQNCLTRILKSIKR